MERNNEADQCPSTCWAACHTRHYTAASSTLPQEGLEIRLKKGGAAALGGTIDPRDERRIPEGFRRGSWFWCTDDVSS